MREYNNSTFYDWFNTPFPADCDIPVLNLPPITIDDSPLPDKIDRYTPDLFSAAIYVASENSVINLTTHFDSPHVPVLSFDDSNPHYTINKDKTWRGRVKIGYCYRKRVEKYATKNYILLFCVF